MSYPRNPNESYYENEGRYERDAQRRRERRDEERDLRREPERFRRDNAASFADEDRPFDEAASRFAGRERDDRFGFEDWERPRRFGATQTDWGQRSQIDWRQRPESRPYRSQSEWQREGRPEWQRSQRFGTQQVDLGEQSGGYYERSGGPFEQRESGGGFAGRGPKNYRRSDQRIQEEVCERLTSDPQVDASEIQVTVKDGEVTIEGTVSERRMKRLAEDCAESVSGVNQVHNRVRVDDSSSQRGQSQTPQQPSTRQGSSRSAS